MKQIFYPFLFIVLLFCTNRSYGQQSNDTTILAGHFEFSTIISGITNSNNVNYSLYPAPFNTDLNVDINTPDTKYLSLDVVNTSGSVLLHWAPTTSSNAYNHLFDITALTSGSYQVNVSDSTATLLHTISFTK